MGHGDEIDTNLALASLTLTRGRARSSRSRWLCSSNLLSLSSVIDCFGPRELIFAGAKAGVQRSVMSWQEVCKRRETLGGRDKTNRGCVGKRGRRLKEECSLPVGPAAVYG